MKKITLIFAGIMLSAAAFGNVVTKEGEAFGYRDRIKVALKIEENKIKEVEITHKDSPKVVDPIIEDFKKQILDKQGPDIEGIAGASYTSEGIKEAVKKALAN